MKKFQCVFGGGILTETMTGQSYQMNYFLWLIEQPSGKLLVSMTKGELGGAGAAHFQRNPEFSSADK